MGHFWTKNIQKISAIFRVTDIENAFLVSKLPIVHWQVHSYHNSLISFLMSSPYSRLGKQENRVCRLYYFYAPIGENNMSYLPPRNSKVHEGHKDP